MANHAKRVVSECVYVDCVEQRHHGGVTTDDRNSKLTFLLVEYEKKPAYLIAFLYVCVCTLCLCE